jgi:hypothetical protein
MPKWKPRKTIRDLGELSRALYGEPREGPPKSTRDKPVVRIITIINSHITPKTRFQGPANSDTRGGTHE